MNILIIITLLTSSIPLLVYIIYLTAVLLTRESQPPENFTIPKITVVIPAYNESKVIEHRIQNFKDINYPSEKIHIIVVDDRSTDDTIELAQKAFKTYDLSGEVLIKQKRSGTNASVNLGIEKAMTDIIVTTDADVIFEKDALKNAMGMLLSDEKIGAVCGELEPIIDEKTFTTRSETAYRSVYGKMCTWESNIHSTYCFNGPLIVLRKKAFSALPEKHGASDAGMALNIIRNGYRCIYVSSAKFSEYIAKQLEQQRRQKLRRSSRLIEATLYNIDMISSKYGRFGTIVFPLRILMFVFVPALFFISIILWSYILGEINILYGLMVWIGLIFALLTGIWSSNIISSFIWHQIYLLISLVYLFRGMHMWKSVDREKV